jgi:aspartate 1-decarboxylase
MLLKVLRAKIHWARVTAKDLNYEGSIAISKELLDEVGIVPYESVLIVNVETGERFETYVIPTEEKGTVQLNGGTARLAEVGDRLIIMAFGWYKIEEAISVKPKVIILNKRNEVVQP